MYTVHPMQQKRERKTLDQSPLRFRRAQECTKAKEH